MGRTHDITISGFDLDRIESRLKAALEDNARIQKQVDDLHLARAEAEDEASALRCQNLAMRNLLFKFSCNTAYAKDAHEFLSNVSHQRHLSAETTQPSTKSCGG